MRLSCRSKIVIIGSGNNGLPIIFGKAAPASPPAGNGGTVPGEKTTAATSVAAPQKPPVRPCRRR